MKWIHEMDTWNGLMDVIFFGDMVGEDEWWGDGEIWWWYDGGRIMSLNTPLRPHTTVSYPSLPRLLLQAPRVREQCHPPQHPPWRKRPKFHRRRKLHLHGGVMDSNWLVVEPPIWKIWVKLEIFPNFRGENKQYLSCHHLAKKFLYKKCIKARFWGDDLWILFVTFLSLKGSLASTESQDLPKRSEFYRKLLTTNPTDSSNRTSPITPCLWCRSFLLVPWETTPTPKKNIRWNPWDQQSSRSPTDTGNGGPPPFLHLFTLFRSSNVLVFRKVWSKLTTNY